MAIKAMQVYLTVCRVRVVYFRSLDVSNNSKSCIWGWQTGSLQFLTLGLLPVEGCGASGGLVVSSVENDARLAVSTSVEPSRPVLAGNSLVGFVTPSVHIMSLELDDPVKDAPARFVTPHLVRPG